MISSASANVTKPISCVNSLHLIYLFSCLIWDCIVAEVESSFLTCQWEETFVHLSFLSPNCNQHSIHDRLVN